MTALRRSVACLGLLAAFAAGCDGRLDMFEPQADASSRLRSPFILDDFEDGNYQSLNIPEGFWYFTPDETCTGSRAVEATTDRAENAFALRTRGGGCTRWGALVGLDLGFTNDVFDASSFDALRLWARAEPGSFTDISVSLLEPYHFDISIELTPEWQEFVLPFDRFAYSDQGPAEPLDLRALTHLQFFVLSAAAFDFWLDDLAFVRDD